MSRDGAPSEPPLSATPVPSYTHSRPFPRGSTSISCGDAASVPLSTVAFALTLILGTGPAPPPPKTPSQVPHPHPHRVPALPSPPLIPTGSQSSSPLLNTHPTSTQPHSPPPHPYPVLIPHPSPHQVQLPPIPSLSPQLSPSPPGHSHLYRHPRLPRRPRVPVPSPTASHSPIPTPDPISPLPTPSPRRVPPLPMSPRPRRTHGAQLGLLPVAPLLGLQVDVEHPRHCGAAANPRAPPGHGRVASRGGDSGSPPRGTPGRGVRARGAAPSLGHAPQP